MEDDLSQRLDNMISEIQKKEFLEGIGLSNEVNIRIFCYPPEYEMNIRRFVKDLKNNKTLKCHIIEFNLYKLFLDICDDLGISDEIPEIEREDGPEYLLEQIQTSIDNKSFVEKMQYSPQVGDLLLLTGVGAVYPFMRVHSLLEAMQSSFQNIPILVMYPGKYDGNSLRLFDEFPASPYYRAFNLF